MDNAKTVLSIIVEATNIFYVYIIFGKFPSKADSAHAVLKT